MPVRSSGFVRKGWPVAIASFATLLAGAALLLLATSAHAVPGGLDNSFASGGTYQFTTAQGLGACR